MGLIDGLLGNAGKVDSDAARETLARWLVPDEEVLAAYRLVRDLIVFTDWRLLLVDKQGLTGSKIEYHSLPYRSIAHFAVETVGRVDLDAELKIWVSGMDAPLERRFNRKVDVYEVQRVLAECIAGRRSPRG